MKNSGNPFQIQIASTDFMDTLVDIVNGGTNTSNAVRQKILSLIQSWGLAFKNRPELGNVYQVYEQLKREGRMFPPVIENEIHTAMIDTIVVFKRCPSFNFSLTYKKIGSRMERFGYLYSL